MTQRRVLVVDDHEVNREMLARRLRRHGYDAVAVGDGPSAIEAVIQSAFDLVLLDIEMPAMSGLEVLRRLRERTSPADLPIVMVSGRQDGDTVVEALGLGANDYITKPIDFAVALARLRAQLARRELEISRRSQDALTGLPNRAALLEWSTARQDLDRPAAALSLNVDRFRTVNNGFGRATGDRLLGELAARLQEATPASGRLARMHADEFVWLLHDTDETGASGLAARALELVRQPFELDGRRATVAASVGIACANSAREPDVLIEQADTAMYRAKTLSGNRFVLFVPALHSRATARLQLEMELQAALAEGAFELRYEPIVDLGSGTVCGFEALARWMHPQRGEVPPAEFIPIAEETGLIVQLGQQVFRMACRQLCEWQRDGTAPPGFCLAVNVSARQLEQPDFVEDLRQTIAAAGVDARGLTLEITESVLMENTERTRRVLEDVHVLGLQIAIDDFGTGYSSLSYLQNFSLNRLKIDRSFIQGLPGAEGTEIVGALIRLARMLGMDVVAEGVELKDELDELRTLGCGYAQGYLFCRPLNAAGALRTAHVRFPMKG